MGGGLRGVASFSLSWDSVSMPVAIFPAARRFLRAAVRLYLRCLIDGAAQVRVAELISTRYPVSAVGMRGRDVHELAPRAAWMKAEQPGDCIRGGGIPLDQPT